VLVKLQFLGAEALIFVINAEIDDAGAIEGG
jgi:hypothetical protein